MNEELLKAIGELLDQKLAPLQKKIEVVDDKVGRIEEKVDKLAAESPQDVMSMLELLNKKLDKVNEMSSLHIIKLPLMNLRLIG
ncbi:hypothetical protein EHV15_26155 [Paenibacillus oralis]|uniref:Uncharacterized protein n=1 Tax=Paenibacillus oralis TaxID=2490856 RepID=A0A3P3U6M5_9BACL|nr:hypothetical protein [Paenibacillus oralis]RRJ66011.1 hypothetical protein EHV15_26155 [Paenibacillus oralis]